MKKAIALTLAVLLCLTLAACASSTPASSGTPGNTSAPGGDKSEFGDNVTLTVMLMPQGDMNDATVTKVTDAVNARIAELGYKFKVQFTWSGGAWGFDTLNTALQTGSADFDIIPAHSWSGAVTYTIGAKNGQYLRLDDPSNNLLDKYGQALYSKTAGAIKTAATVPGDQGVGIYGYIIEKDSVQQLGYLVNKTLLEELGFTMADFKADDIASWEPLFKAYKEKYPNGYPFNAEAEVLDRTVNHIAFVGGTTGPLGVVFDNADPAGKAVSMVSRYETQAYQDIISIMHGYYEAGYIDPDQGVPGDISAGSLANRRTAGDFLVSTFGYAPGAENMVAASASDAQGKTVEIAWAPGWSSPISSGESALASGLAVYAGCKNVPEAVTFLNMLASDTVIGNLLSEGTEGADGSYTVKDGIIWRNDGRAGWNVWRYGVVGATSAATPLGDVDANGKEWVNFKEFNGQAKALESASFLFDISPVDAQYTACVATIAKYFVPLGSGAADPAQHSDLVAELKADGIDEVVAEIQAQYEAFKKG